MLPPLGNLPIERFRTRSDFGCDRLPITFGRLPAVICRNPGVEALGNRL